MGTSWVNGLRRWVRLRPEPGKPVIGVALGGGFARGIAHLGVLRVLERHNVPIHMIAGVSAGAIVASAYASGRSVHEIAGAGRAMRFTDVADWKFSLPLLGLAASAPMAEFLGRLLKVHRFEEMRMPLAVVATDLSTGTPVVFRGKGDVTPAIRASCSYPGLFQPVRYQDRYLVDGAMTMEVPAPVLRKMGATHVIGVCLPVNGHGFDPRNMFQVINRCFQILQTRAEREWRRYANVVLEPNVHGMAWDRFDNAEKLIESGEKAALAALPRILSWLGKPVEGVA
jgi:NTE family protein